MEGDVIPKQKMSIFELEDKTRIAVRGSGTEPKIKYYIFAQHRPAGEKFTADQLKKIKGEIGRRLENVWNWLETDARSARWRNSCSTIRRGSTCTARLI